MSPNIGIIASSISGHLTPAYDPSSYDALASYVIPSGQTATQVVFAGIPSGYKHLEIRTAVLSSVNPQSDIVMRFNNDSTSGNYSQHLMYTSGGSSVNSAYGPTNYVIGGLNGSATYPAPSICTIFDYANTTKYKSTWTMNGNNTNGTTGQYLFADSGNWLNLNAITTITLSAYLTSVWQPYSSFELYGIK